MAVDELLADRLATFFVDWRGAQRGGQGSPLPDRLARFFEQFRSLKADAAKRISEPPQQCSTPLDHTVLGQMFECLRKPLEQARAAGAFSNVWTIAGLRRDETRNTAVLASFFDQKSHREIGADFLWAFLQRVGRSATGLLPDEGDVRRGYTVRTEDIPIGREDTRVDISIEGSGFLVLIEVKIDAGEGLNQLSKYNEVLQTKADLLEKRRALIYLSPRPPKLLPPNGIHATWNDVVVAAGQAGRRHKPEQRPLFASLLLQFAAHAAAFT